MESMQLISIRIKKSIQMKIKRMKSIYEWKKVYEWKAFEGKGIRYERLKL